MKKIYTLAVSLFIALNIFATENNMSNAEAFTMDNVNLTKLSESLNASSDQSDAIIDVMNLFVNQMECIKTVGSTSSREKMLNNAVEMNIKYMKSILNREQYKRYLTILNSTLVNRGLK